jgi:hypothetical protein
MNPPSFEIVKNSFVTLKTHQGIYKIVSSIIDNSIFVIKKGSKKGDSFLVEVSEIESLVSYPLSYKPKKDGQTLSREEKRVILTRLVKPEKLEPQKKYLTELVGLNKLLKLYPDKSFWLNFTPSFQCNSIFYWLGGGSSDLRTYYNKITLNIGLTNEGRPPILQEEKVGEDYVSGRKKKVSLLDL